jgi:hypothetical protein
MVMPQYTFELTFTGLCIFTFNPNKRTPTEVNALLVKAFHHPTPHEKHLPFLSYRPENLQKEPTPPHRLVPGPEGTQTALQDIAGRTLLLEPPSGHSQALTATWRPVAVATLPASPPAMGDEDWLDWAMALQRMNPETKDPTAGDPYVGLKQGQITTRIQLKNGALKAKNFLKETPTKYATWDFKEPKGVTILATHAMAGVVSLSLSGIPHTDPVKITGSSFAVVLQPVRRVDGTFESEVRASITNLPELENPQPRPLYLEHFTHFYDPVVFQTPPAKLRLPHPHTGVITTSNTFCPPTTHTIKE